MEKQNAGSSVFISISTPVEEIAELLATSDQLNFIHIKTDEVTSNPNETLLQLARKNADIKQRVVALANAGFHLYVHRPFQSSMVRHRRIRSLWQSVIAGSILCDENDIFYTVEPAASQGTPRLLVVFSSIATKMYTPSLVRHFEQNFSTIKKYVTPNTYILRIADFGSVVGSFYLNSNALPNNEENIRKRIETTAADLGVASENIVLYGTSKGGTAATFYALSNGWRAVAVDPILSDEHYVKTFNDSHFTLGTFPATKEQRFADLVTRPHDTAKLVVVCSSRSPQYQYISDTLISRFENRFLFLNSENEEIMNHPDVGPKTIPHTLAQINSHLAGLNPHHGLRTVW